MQNTSDGGVDNPAMTLDPVASFSLGEPEDVDTDVAITVTDYDKGDTSIV